MKKLKKIFAFVMCICFALSMIGCSQNEYGANGDGVDEEGNVQLPSIAYDLVFSSGAGAWGTELTLSPDGTFVGEYHDSEMGDNGTDYPKGTVYTSVFTGKFGNIQKVDDCTYTMELVELNLEKTDGEEWIEDGIRYVATQPYGLDGSETFTLYTPDKETADFSEEFISWWPYKETEEGSLPEKLLCFGLCNDQQQYGFFTYQ